MLLSEILSNTTPLIKQTNAKPDNYNFNWDRYQPDFEKTPPKYKELGSGVSSVNFSHKDNPDIVIKSIQINHGHYADSSEYQFLRACLNHQDNPWFPKIYNAKLYKSSNKIIVKMEKLEKLTKEDYRKLIKIFNVGYIVQNKRTMRDVEITLRGKFNTPQNVEELIKNTTNTRLQQAFRLLKPFFKKYGSDLHFDNIMKRKNGHFVLLDPVFPL